MPLFTEARGVRLLLGELRAERELAKAQPEQTGAQGNYHRGFDQGAVLEQFLTLHNHPVARLCNKHCLSYSVKQ